MFTEEHNDSCTLSYLEGVDSMPDLNGIDEKLRRKWRSSIIQSVVLFYLDFVKDHRGIKRCNFFASSPHHGTECYIFNHRPNPNFLSKKKRQSSLIRCYDSLIAMGQQRGIVKRRAYIDEELIKLSKTSHAPLLDFWRIDPDFWAHAPELIE